MRRCRISSSGRALTKGNIALNSVNTIIIKPPEMIPALNTKQIDAFVAWEPYPAKAVTAGVGEVLAYSSDLWPKHPCCVVVVDTQFMDKNPRIGRGEYSGRMSKPRDSSLTSRTKPFKLA